MGYFEIFVELIIGYFALFITVKFLGKTQISQITPLDFISALVLGDLVSGAVFEDRVNFVKVLFAVFVWGLLIYMTDFASQKSRRLRLIFEGKPSIIINHGKIDMKELKKNRLDIDQLQQLLRSKNVFSLQDVTYAIYENNGDLNILQKPELEIPTYKDLKIPTEKDKKVPVTIISDGEVLFDNLHQAGLNENWLQKELKKSGIKQPKEICYAEWQTGQPLYVQKYDHP